MSDDAPKPGVPAGVVLEFSGGTAPPLTARGRERLAERIETLARENEIPLNHDPELTALLSQIPTADDVPDALHRAISSMLTFAYNVSGQPERLPDESEDRKRKE